jgi:hypothetical protein
MIFRSEVHAPPWSRGWQGCILAIRTGALNWTVLKAAKTSASWASVIVSSNRIKRTSQGLKRIDQLQELGDQANQYADPGLSQKTSSTSPETFYCKGCAV